MFVSDGLLVRMYENKEIKYEELIDRVPVWMLIEEFHYEFFHNDPSLNMCLHILENQRGNVLYEVVLFDDKYETSFFIPYFQIKNWVKKNCYIEKKGLKEE